MYDPAHPFGKKRYDRAIIDPVSCTGCGYCTMFCVMDCILLQPDGFYTVDLDRCIGCRSCKVNCPFEAVIILPPKEDASSIFFLLILLCKNRVQFLKKAAVIKRPRCRCGRWGPPCRRRTRRRWRGPPSRS